MLRLHWYKIEHSVPFETPAHTDFGTAMQWLVIVHLESQSIAFAP